MNEEQIQEPRAPYMVTGQEAGEELVTGTFEAGEERPLERLQVQLPPYFDRFLEERDRRIASELSRLEAAIAHNGTEIARLLREMENRFTQAKEE
ncbi:MAG: hypothetical protein QHJ81_15010, partial [Anaerolineae bacterium]|nr:hypothetical protein [Anaerolineae bacterium]